MEKKVTTIRIRELDALYGDRVKTITVEEAQELDFKFLTTVLPNGEVVNSFEELLAALRDYPGPEVEIIRFPPMAGG